MPNPFYYGGKITVPTQFVGRRTELSFVLQRMQAAQMTSVGVTGPRRIGKSSLLYHIYQTHPQSLTNPAGFLVAYVTLQDVSVRTQAGLVGELSAQLARARSRHTAAASLPPWPAPCPDLITFRGGLQAMAAAGLRSVLCLDEFEALLEEPRQFDDRFYDGLRAMMDDQLLMLIIASARPLSYYGSRYRLVSRFFNLGATLPLGEFNAAEADALLMLPAEPGGPPALGAQDRALALELGGRRPQLLQMAAAYLYTANTEGHDEAWVRRQFAAQAAPYRTLRARLQAFGARLLRSPAALGRAAGRIGRTWDEIGNWIVGLVIVLLLLLLFSGRLPLGAFFCWLQQTLNIGQGGCA
jgi:hypothetical protein